MYHLYAQPQYIDYAALAEARAAEAAAKAAEAEYLAQQARARAHSRLWAPPALSHRHSCGCPSCADLYEPHLGYAPHRQEDCASAFGRHGCPQVSKYPHARQQPRFAHAELAHQNSLSELELELEKERKARIQLELELERLKAREQRLSRTPSIDPVSKRQSQKPSSCPAKTKVAGTHPRSNTLLDGDVPRQYGFVWSQPAPCARPRAATAKPASSACSPSVAAEDLITDMIVQSLDADRQRHTKVQKPKPKEPLEATSKDQPDRQGDKGSLLDQLKARYEREGEDEVRDTIRSVLNSVSTSSQQPNQSSPRPKQTRQATVTSGNDLLEAILGNILNKAPARPSGTTSSSAGTSEAGAQSTTGKGKENLASSVGTPASTSKDVVEALQKVEKIERTFRSLKAEFAFPAELDFNPPVNSAKDTDPTAIFPHLSFTARNHPVRYYEQSLSSLLQELDLIESHGDANLRMKRKRIARIIEEALEELEREVAGRWKAAVTKQDEKEKEGQKIASSHPSAIQNQTEPEAEASVPVRIPVEDGAPKSEPRQNEAEVHDVAGRDGLVSEEPTPIQESEPEGSKVDGEETPTDRLTPKEASSSATGHPCTDEHASGRPHPEGAEPTEESTVPESVPAKSIDSDEHVVSTTGAPSSMQEESSTNSEWVSEPALPLEIPTPTVEVPAEDVAAVTQTAIGKDEALVNRGLVEVTSPSNSSPPSPTVTEDGRDTSDENAFLLAQPSPPEFKTDEMKSKRRRSVEVEDLGSDWEDVDGA